MRIEPRGVWSDIQAIKQLSPLIHNITNFVVMEQTANALLAIGASPIMAHAPEEVQEMTQGAKSLVLNIGTLSCDWVHSMGLAQAQANQSRIPVIFDPVGAGASHYRTEVAYTILGRGGISAVRGNASEIVSLYGGHGNPKGVDSSLVATEYLEEAKSLAIKQKCVVWVSGVTDVITNGGKAILIHNGSPLMGKVTGMGCSATAIAGAFLAVNSDFFIGCAHAAILMGIAGEIASQKARGPGSFIPAFLDALYSMTEKQIVERMRVDIL